MHGKEIPAHQRLSGMGSPPAATAQEKRPCEASACEMKTVTQSKGCPVAFGFDIGNQLFRDIYYEYLKLAET